MTFCPHGISQSNSHAFAGWVINESFYTLWYFMHLDLDANQE